MRTGRPRIDLSAYAHLVGVLPDSEVARMAGCTRQTVRNHRIRPSSGMPTTRAPNLPKYRHLMGVVPDSEVARMAGCHLRTVWKYRHSLGIPSTRLLSPFRRFRWAFGRIPDVVISRLARLPRAQWSHSTSYARASGYPTRRIKGWPGFTFRRSREAI